ncbi:MAG: protein kinase [Pseudomonadales bacterium]|nr:protein kinase [Pseudomonadales bacterium]
MQTLEQLKSGQLIGIKQLCLRENLSQFPEEIFELADSLEILDLSGNQLSSLPDDFHQLHKLRILFLSNNHFTCVPEVLAKCPELEMIGFKSNQITTLPENALPLQTRWLILTDNKIEKLPDSMGRLYRLQKLALAGNRLSEIPASMADCKSLELARLSANNLSAIPDAFLQLPKLAWLAIAGNAFNRDQTDDFQEMLKVPLSAMALAEKLGEGASGIIYKAQWLQQPPSLSGTDKHIAVKVFKGDVTSDGYPEDELANCLRAGNHDNLVKVIAQVNEAGNSGLVMELIPASYKNLGLPPCFVTCTRDTFSDGTDFKTADIAKIAWAMADTLAHLHANNISHGDIYAHNTMIDSDANMLLGDFGAASNLSPLSDLQQQSIQAIEVRAFACLLDDLLALNDESDQPALRASLLTLRDAGEQTAVLQRPNFKDIALTLKDLNTGRS